MKNNPNQICWLLEKVQRSTEPQSGFTSFQQFLDNQQYTNRGILRYEKMFGAGYVSTGGLSTTKVKRKRKNSFCLKLHLKRLKEMTHFKLGQ